MRGGSRLGSTQCNSHNPGNHSKCKVQLGLQVTKALQKNFIAIRYTSCPFRVRSRSRRDTNSGVTWCAEENPLRKTLKTKEAYTGTCSLSSCNLFLPRVLDDADFSSTCLVIRQTLFKSLNSLKRKCKYKLTN